MNGAWSARFVQPGLTASTTAASWDAGMAFLTTLAVPHHPLDPPLRAARHGVEFHCAGGGCVFDLVPSAHV